MEKYMFIFSSDETSLSPETQQTQMQKWHAWVQKLQGEKRYVSGEALIPGIGKTVTGPKKTVTDGPFAEGKEVVGGYFIVFAKDLAEATEMAKECPDCELGGRVEVREVMKFDNM